MIPPLINSTISMSNFFRLNTVDFVKGFVVAVLAAIFAFLAQAFSVPGFDLYTFNWALVGQVAVSAAMAYLAKNLFTTQSGSFMGITPPTRR